MNIKVMQMNKIGAKTGVVFLIVFFVLSIVLILKYVEKERNRDLTGWQSRLSILVDIQRSKIENHLQMRRAMLDELASNPSLQLYLSQYELLQRTDDEIVHAQFAHLRNLLSATAKRFGFGETSGRDSVNTEFIEDRLQGLAVLGAKGDLLLASRGFPKELTQLEIFIQRALSGENPVLIDVFATKAQPVYGYVVPVFPVQQLSSQQTIGAVLVLLRAQELYALLKNAHVDTQTDETLLVSQRNGSLVYLSELKQTFKVLHQMPLTNTDLASVFALNNPGSFASKLDYLGQEVLVTGRKLENTPWTVVQKITTAEALAESDRHQRFLLTSFLLLTAFIAAMFIAIWRHSTSLRLQRITSALEARTALLNAVSDNINEHIFLVDNQSNFVFANLSMAKCLAVKPEDVVGKSMASVLGTDVAETINQLSCERDSGSLPCMVSLPIGHEESTYHVSTVTLQQGEYSNTRLFVLHDISVLRREQEKRDRLARGIISTLVKAVDLHDPYCVDHSERTREVALAIAKELRLEKSRCDALELAALLANIGKLFVPREILIKMEPLSADENNILKKHVDYSVDILKQLEFEGPVVEIIAQKNEHLDGSGYPVGRSANEIMIEGRILAVANAFVAMASSRAYREGRSINSVIDILLSKADSHYDRHVVAALFHIAENKTDWKRWQSVNSTS